MTHMSQGQLQIPEDLSPADALAFIEECHDAIYDLPAEEGAAFNPDMKGYLLQLLTHLETLAKDSLEFIKNLDEAIEKLDFANDASKILLRYEISRLPLLNETAARKVLDKAHQALDAKPPSPKSDSDQGSTGDVTRIGDSIVQRPGW